MQRPHPEVTLGLRLLHSSVLLVAFNPLLKWKLNLKKENLSGLVVIFSISRIKSAVFPDVF